MAVLCALFPLTPKAAAEVRGSFVINGDGTVTYFYEVDNLSGLFDVSAWSLDLDLETPDWNMLDTQAGGDVTVPNDFWIAGEGVPVSGESAQDFLSLDPLGDVLIGTVLGGFSFTSAGLPGIVVYHEFSADGRAISGLTIGPMVVVPESAGLLGAVALVVLAILTARRGRSDGVVRRILAPVLAVTLVSGSAFQGWAAPVIQSLAVEPAPLRAGDDFTISLVASADAASATATVDLRSAAPGLLRVPLTKNGNTWTGTGRMPAGLAYAPGMQAAVNAYVFDANRQRSLATIRVDIAFMTAMFDPATGVLTIIGDHQDNTIHLSRDTADNIQINGGSLPIQGGVPNVANTVLIRALGLGGNDEIRVIGAGSPTPVEFHGGPGNDVLVGGGRADRLYGGPGADRLEGVLGVDELYGDADADTLLGGDGDDRLNGGEGADAFEWNPGDDNDVIEGDGGIDLLTLNGAAANETVELIQNGARLRMTRNVANIVLDAGGVEEVRYNARAGTDLVIVNDLREINVTAVIVDLSSFPGSDVSDAQADRVLVRGTPDDDEVTVAVTPEGSGCKVTGLGAMVTIRNSSFAQDQVIIESLEGNDSIDASPLTRDVIQLVAEGGPGADRFIAIPQGVRLDVVGNSPRLGIYHSGTNLVVDADDVEEVFLEAQGATNSIAVTYLGGTDVADVWLKLSDGSGPAIGDGEPDSVTVLGSNGADVILVNENASAVTVLGLGSRVSITGADPALDQLVVIGQNGADSIDASALPAGLIQFVASGGLERDIILGSEGDDVLMGGDADDFFLGGPGNDTFVWNPGDDNDTLEGESGSDLLLFNGSNAFETIEISANGPRLRFFRNVANVVMDGNGIEEVRFNASGGNDMITVFDLTGTGVTRVGLNLAQFGTTSPDAQPDTIIVHGTTGADDILVTDGTPGVTVSGLSAEVSVLWSTAAQDRLFINAFDGDDSVDASGLSAGLIQLIVDGGLGNDTLVGSAGDDALYGGDDDDILIGGPGADLLDGGSGNNVITQD